LVGEQFVQEHEIVVAGDGEIVAEADLVEAGGEVAADGGSFGGHDPSVLKS
jgi:hypothetical protein